MIGADIGDYGDVIVCNPNAATQDSAARRLGDGELNARVLQHLAGTTRTGEVPGLDKLPVYVDAIGA